MNPPKHLSTESQAFWKATLVDFELDRHHLLLLRAALESWDEMLSARELLNGAEPVYLDRFGAPHVHPLVVMAQKSRDQFARLMRQLDLEGSPDPSRRRS